MFNQADKDGFRLIITPIEKNLVNGNLKIVVMENVKIAKILNTNF